MGQLVRRQLQGKTGHWLLTLVISGTPYRFATATLDIEARDGITDRYNEGLPDIEHRLTSEGSTEFTIPITLQAGVAWRSLVANFASIERAPATIHRWFEGQTLPEARLVLDGQLEGFAYGEELEPVTFSVVRRIRTRSVALPTPNMVADATTFPVRVGLGLPETSLGLYYPIIIGAPGTTAGVTNGNPATDGIMVEFRQTPPPPDDHRLMIAGHRVEATTVNVSDYSDPDGPVTNLIAVQEMQDLVGRTISYVDMAVFAAEAESTRPYYISWSAQDGGGGLVSTTSNTLLRGAGDVILWLYQTWTDQPIDAARFAAVREFLNGYKIDSYVNTRVDPIEWFNGELLPLLPIVPYQGEDGLYFRLRNFSANPWEAVGTLDADLGQIRRASAVTTQSDQIVNEVTIQFQPDRSTGRFRARRIISTDDNSRGEDELEGGFIEDDQRIIGSYRAKLSQSLFGRQPISIEASAVWDESTAIRIAEDIIAEQALPKRFVDYTGEIDLEAYEVGDAIILNDSLVQLNNVVALILDMTVGGSDVTLHLELVDDPIVLERLAIAS